MSFFSWLDYSEHERRKALDVISLFRERETRDELGIGAIRDAFADLLFPGISTIQTRARYFLFVPWIHRGLERKKVPCAQFAARARAEEVRLMEALASSADPEGTIGVEAKAALKRLPSSIYWHGLGVLGIRTFQGSQDDYYRSVDRFYARQATLLRDDDGEPVSTRGLHNWHPAIPPEPDGFPRQASFRLTRAEAEYLRERILLRAPGTLLAFLVGHGRPAEPVAFPWLHPQAGEFPAEVREHVRHARFFSEVMHGAALLYNLMLAESKPDQCLVEHYTHRLEVWWRECRERPEALGGWDRNAFWGLMQSMEVRLTPLTRRFVNSWLDLALSFQSAKECFAREEARSLIRDRERLLKGDRARLQNRRALEQWSGAAGVAQLNYRWPVVQTQLADILAALGRES